jgi:hypothetical protein
MLVACQEASQKFFVIENGENEDYDNKFYVIASQILYAGHTQGKQSTRR